MYPLFTHPLHTTTTTTTALEDPKGLDGPSNLMNFIKHTGFSAGTYADTVLGRIVIPVAQLSEVRTKVAVVVLALLLVQRIHCSMLKHIAPTLLPRVL